MNKEKPVNIEDTPRPPAALNAAPKRVAFVTGRPKDVPRLFCRTDIIKPNGAEIVVHPDTAVVVVYRTIGHAAMDRVEQATNKAGVPMVQAGTGARRTLADVEARCGLDLDPWRVRGFWKGVVGRFLAEQCVRGKTWEERTDIVNAYFKALRYRHRFTRQAIDQALRSSHPDLPLVDGRHPKPKSARPAPAPRIEAPPAVIADGAYPDPQARSDFQAAAETLARLMQAAGVTEVTFITDDTGKVLWSGKEKVVRVVEQGFTNEVG